MLERREDEYDKDRVTIEFKFGEVYSFIIRFGWGLFLHIASPQQDDLRLSGPPSNQDGGRGARTRNRRVPADLKADSLSTVPPIPHVLRN
ncbi:hypothetical protein PoB_001012300 [Plakobranchus ocellatus]|uniref:Uncharacterized protein n=1 Tax=Plakobranchus ocellatus TaxID=259542 RepID=A0AAV3YMV3_9GAST|nr:hypothetical protein PoB_001012300 [Plakobranchus ocellatus]